MNTLEREQSIVDRDGWVSYSLDDLYPEWQTKAHCAGVGVEYYFGEEEENRSAPMSIKQVRRAAKLCEVCPVYTECLRWALEMREEYGVWAGTSGRVRRNIFVLLDRGEYTVDEVIEEFRNGQGSRFRRTDVRRDPDPCRADLPAASAGLDGAADCRRAEL